MKRCVSIVVLSAALFSMIACADPEFYRVELRQIGDAPADVDISDTRIRLPAGIAVEIDAEVSFRGDEYLTGEFFHLDADDSTVFGVSPMAGKQDKYLIWGKRRGSSCLEINVAGTVEACIPVTVVEPEAQ